MFFFKSPKSRLLIHRRLILNEFKKIIRIICIVIFLLAVVVSITSTTQSVKTRRLCNSLREQLTRATDSVAELGGTITDCQSICRELEGTTTRSIETARDAINVIEEIRIGVQELENRLGICDSSEYYNYWDGVFGLD